jgi:pimeloyl-ACP methyl ester carboxylesterase
MISVNLESMFGKLRKNLAQWDPVIVIRHGICSSFQAFVKLAAYLQKSLPQATIDNQNYPWRDSVLVNGARLANHILKTYSPDRPLVLVGHSMGGLVCRIANIALRDPSSFVLLVSGQMLGLGYAGTEMLEIQNLRLTNHPPRSVERVITLATPNSGAALQGQVTGIAALLQVGINAFPPTRSGSVADLTSDRLFRLLQNFCVDTPTLSISGSKGNRFALGSGQLTAWLTKAGLRLEMPHDLIVEDRSVDLRNSILPNEIVQQGSTPYLHMRTYLDCTDVTHTNIYDDVTVRETIVDCISRC